MTRVNSAAPVSQVKMDVQEFSLAESKSKIGLKRALGTQQSDIQSQFLIESVLLCLAEGIIDIKALKS